jgi:hypothetical protein
MGTGPARLGPLSESTANYTPVLSSERAPTLRQEVSSKHVKMKVMSWVPKRC